MGGKGQAYELYVIFLILFLLFDNAMGRWLIRFVFG